VGGSSTVPVASRNSSVVADTEVSVGELPTAQNLATSCRRPDGSTATTLNPKGGAVDVTNVPAWIPVFGGPTGFAGCVAKTLMMPGVDNSTAEIALKRASGVYNPRLRVFTPDGQLSGYIVVPGGIRRREHSRREGTHSRCHRRVTADADEPRRHHPLARMTSAQLPIVRSL
jgi:hypothetical protein